MTKKSTTNSNLIKHVESTFQQVSNKIDGLINCSVKDFVLLNSAFKNYHNVIQTLASSTEDYQNIILSNTANAELSTQCSIAESAVNDTHSIIVKQLKFLKELRDKYSYLLLCSNNLRQDLSTIHLLFANIRFDPSIKIDLNEMTSCYNNLHKAFLDNEKLIKGQSDKIVETIDFSIEGFSNSLELFSSIIDKVKEQSIDISKLQLSAKSINKQISSIEEKKKTSTSEIITNLQFQDILRQKIEHIQEAQGHITEKLYKNHTPNSDISQDELFQIRDISALQSALLIHANQEYQTAVENILQRINELKWVYEKYNSLWCQVCLPEKTSLQSKLTKIAQEISILQNQAFSINQFAEKYGTLLKKITKQNQAVVLLKSVNNKANTEIQKLQNLICNSDASAGTGEFSPLTQLKDECKKICAGYQKMVRQLNDIDQTNINDFSVEFEKPLTSTKTLNACSDVISDIIKLYLKELNATDSNTNNAQSQIAFNVEQVNYYKTFEKEVQEITELLDQLLKKVNLNKQDLDPDKLEELKEMYTMESEREVHENLTKERKQDTTEEDDSDEVEFF